MPAAPAPASNRRNSKGCGAGCSRLPTDTMPLDVPPPRTSHFGSPLILSPDCLGEPCCLRVINTAYYCSLSYSFNGFIYGNKRDKKPFSRNDRLPEAVRDFDVEAGRAEDAVDQVLKPGAVDVVQLISGDDLDICHEERRVEASIGDPARDIATRHADLVQNITMGGDGRMIGFAAQHIDDAACFIPLTST
jgi:hypothetical protein